MLERFRLDGQVAIVTGGGRGIGRGIALALAEAGADVALAGRTAASLEEVATAIRTAGRRAIAVPTDVRSTADVERLADRAAAELGRIDILVNNAGIALEKHVMDMTDEDWAAVIETNLSSVFRCCRAVGRYMIPQRRGKIINVASMYAYTSVNTLSSYSASKAGMLGFMRGLALDWARYNIQVNAIAPGYIHTDLNDAAMRDPQMRELLVRSTPLRRIGAPEDVAPAVVYLASSASDYMTGATIVIDGGFIIR
jgi:2-deoxy-D-gluconate 3-dehydrogenase